ncbi:hypothetical protein Y032_0029g1894 [Ancylostoma ceylanicum]|uniref:Reverse transcriptase domain-containing protein n=2 Tax=Ancylostoma ceylanicum TaxID=53326 RepID=A0A016URI9_9BILA|nr:hypothetical protein Y032_0029g1894 [Ancylostoma ceylanicum]
MESIMANFHTALYRSESDQTTKVLSPGEEVPPFLMLRGKAPGVDGITLELLQACGPTLYTALARRFSLYLAKCKVPVAWKQSSTILLFEKGDKEDLENYRPITLLPVLYKVSTRCIMTRIRRTLDEAQPVVQGGFRRKFSTLDHIITCCRLIEVAREYREPLVLTFNDYKKAFDSVVPAKVWEALEEQGVQARHIKVLSECYSGYTTVFRPFLNDIEVSVEKGVRQGFPASPNLFSACLESVIRNCDWSTFGVLIDGEPLNHLRFADDIVLITRSPDDASEMLRRIDEEGSKAGLTINKTKTKFMRSAFSSRQPVLLQGVPLEDVREYVYLGRLLNMEYKIKPKIARRGRAGWAAYNSIKSVLEDTKGQKLRADLFNSTVLPALCYASKHGQDQASDGNFP